MKPYHAQVMAPASRDTFWRTLQTFTVTRVAIAMVLLIYLSINTRKGFWMTEHFLYRETCGAYLVLAIGFSLLSAYARRRFLLQTVSQIAIDLIVISMLYVAAGGVRSGLGILYLFPLAGSAILAPLLLALFFVSAATLVMLGESGFQMLQASSDSTFSQVGLYGAAFFSAVYVIHRLAARLINQERLAAQHGHDLQVQLAINRLVIADMGDGILVVGNDSTLLTANPAAERMLGLPLSEEKLGQKLTDLPPLAPIADAFLARMRLAADGAGADNEPALVVIKPGEDASTANTGTGRSSRRDIAVHLKLRFATADAAGLDKDRTVIFLQDVGEIENKAQELKLASMGRLTASIAHEVRNPLSAISYAASLLAEESSTAAQARLIHIVDDNVARLNRMIEDILRLSRKAQSHGESVLLAPALAGIIEEFEETHSVRHGIIRIASMQPYRVSFDPLHLREVIVNLLSNALRYASGADGSIRIFGVSDAASRLEMHVQDDGPAISPQVRAHLFEPFYTTSSKGTGLGLYVARELCLNNQAVLDYEYRIDSVGNFPAGGRAPNEVSGRFVITFPLSGHG
jgi:two-component system sensor histidine kinase PilS (NtrC family)